ncbi:hypothetical protein BC629DRAFT_1139766 [Irpex lacteus]|nr:hypothetical protein BC629DRAFT_1139766 [Irpex lacteus]
MTLVAPSHISIPTLPTQQLDIAYNPASASSDPATPRVILSHAALDIVAAAVTLAPALAPALPAENPEYCLSSKRKSIDDDPLDIPRISKRLRSEDDALFGSLADTPLQEVSPDVDPVQATIIEQALAAIFSCPSPQVVEPSPVTDLPAPQPEPCLASTSRITHSPLATSITASSIDSLEASTSVARPLVREPSPPRNRIVEPPLWKMACRMRVDQV